MKTLMLLLSFLGLNLSYVFAQVSLDTYTDNFIKGLDRQVYRYNCKYSLQEQDVFLRGLMSFLYVNDLKNYSSQKKQELILCTSKTNFALILPIMTKFYLGSDDKEQREALIQNFNKIDKNILTFSNALYDIAKERYVSGVEDFAQGAKEEKIEAMKSACNAFMNANENGKKAILNLTYRGSKINQILINQLCSFK